MTAANARARRGNRHDDDRARHGGPGRRPPAAGGSALARFDDILAAAAAELAGHVQAVKLDADTGRLYVAPAYGPKLPWSTPKLIAAANGQVPGATVRTLDVLPPEPVKDGPFTAADDPGPAAGRARSALAAPGATGRLPPRDRGPPPGRAATPVGPGHRCGGEAADRRDEELFRRASPEPDVVSDDAAAPIEAARTQRRHQAAATEAAALPGGVELVAGPASPIGDGCPRNDPGPRSRHAAGRLGMPPHWLIRLRPAPFVPPPQGPPPPGETPGAQGPGAALHGTPSGPG